MDDEEFERQVEYASQYLDFLRDPEGMESMDPSEQDAYETRLLEETVIGPPFIGPLRKELVQKMRGWDEDLWALGDFGPCDQVLSRGILSKNPEDDYTGDERYDAVLIWDLEEITKLSEEVTEEPILQPDISILNKYMNNILASIGLNDEKEINVDNIEEIMNDGTDIMNRMGPKYKELGKLYEQMKEGKMDPNGMINYDIIEKCGMKQMWNQVVELYGAVEQHQTRWSQCWKEANQCLKLINNRPVDQHPKMTNVVISRQGIAHASVQLLISNNASMIPIKNLYTVANSSNEQILEKIKYRFGKRCRFAMITTSEPLADAAGTLRIPTWRNGNWQQIRWKTEEVVAVNVV